MKCIRIIIFNLDRFEEYSDTLYDTVFNLKNMGYILYGVCHGSAKELNRKINELKLSNIMLTSTFSDMFLLKEHYLSIFKMSDDISIDGMMVIDHDYNDICIAKKLNLKICLENSLTDILSTVAYYQDVNYGIGKKTMFKKNINIVIPLIGDGTGFKTSEYRQERNLVDMMGKPFITWVINNLQIDANYIFVIREHLCRIHKINGILKSLIPDCTIIKSETITQGNACSILLAEKLVNNDNPLIILNDNQWLSWDVEEYLIEFLLKEKATLEMITFKNNNSCYNYIKTDEDDKHVLYMRQNLTISEYAITDVYFWRKGSQFLKYTHRMTSRNQRIRGEFCTTLVMNELFDDIQSQNESNNSVIHKVCDAYFVFKEPNDITEFENWYNERKFNPFISLQSLFF